MVLEDLIICSVSIHDLSIGCFSQWESEITVFESASEISPFVPTEFSNSASSNVSPVLQLLLDYAYLDMKQMFTQIAGNVAHSVGTFNSFILASGTGYILAYVMRIPIQTSPTKRYKKAAKQAYQEPKLTA